MLAKIDESIVLFVDFQPKFMATMPDAAAVVSRANFLGRVAQRLGVPILATEQYPERMGPSDPKLFEFMNALPPECILAKMEFSAFRAPGMMEALQAYGRRQVIVAGVETHICVNQTVHDLIDAGYATILATDAITGRGEDARAGAIRRMVATGAIESHTESITYEWMESASNPAFRDILGMVKG